MRAPRSAIPPRPHCTAGVQSSGQVSKGALGKRRRRTSLLRRTNLLGDETHAHSGCRPGCLRVSHTGSPLVPPGQSCQRPDVGGIQAPAHPPLPEERRHAVGHGAVAQVGCCIPSHCRCCTSVPAGGNGQEPQRKTPRPPHVVAVRSAGVSDASTALQRGANRLGWSFLERQARVWLWCLGRQLTWRQGGTSAEVPQAKSRCSPIKPRHFALILTPGAATILW